jgi:hypothetical protein
LAHLPFGSQPCNSFAYRHAYHPLEKSIGEDIFLCKCEICA